MHALVTSFGQDRYYMNVTDVTADNGYVHLVLAEHPHLVHYHLASTRVRVLLAATDEDFTALLRERDDNEAWTGHGRF